MNLNGSKLIELINWQVIDPYEMDWTKIRGEETERKLKLTFE